MNMSKSKNAIEKRVRGALYGFAIGDAMGATTEFMKKKEIQRRYGKVDDILGGGWLNLKPGQVTDDTQMTMCVIDALMKAKNESQFRTAVKAYFIDWYLSNPPDIGNQCKISIECLMSGQAPRIWKGVSDGNGSLMRALPCALLNNLTYNQIQGDLTHPSKLCQQSIQMYHKMIIDLVYRDENIRRMLWTNVKHEPTGYVVDTLVNAVYWANKDSLEECIVGAVNDGGDADTIAAIAGSMAGAHWGVDAIPSGWIEKIDSEVIKKMDQFTDFILKKYNKGFENCCLF